MASKSTKSPLLSYLAFKSLCNNVLSILNHFVCYWIIITNKILFLLIGDIQSFTKTKQLNSTEKDELK